MATWIDAASDWIANISVPRDAAQPFTDAQTRLLQELLKQSFTQFASVIADKVGEHLSLIKLEIKQIKTQSEMHDPCEVATPGEVATNSGSRIGSHKTVTRRERRKRCKNKAAIQRSLFLQCRPSKDIVQQLGIENGVSRFSTALAHRTGEKELLIEANSVALVQRCQGAIPAEKLARECEAVRTIQREWRSFMSVHCGVQPSGHLSSSDTGDILGKNVVQVAARVIQRSWWHRQQSLRVGSAATPELGEACSAVSEIEEFWNWMETHSALTPTGRRCFSIFEELAQVSPDGVSTLLQCTGCSSASIEKECGPDVALQIFKRVCAP